MSEDDMNELGTDEEIADAREKLKAVQDTNTYTVVQIIGALNKRIMVESATLTAICEAAPHLFTRFLIKEASESLAQAARLLTAAMELLPIDAGEVSKGGGLILPEPTQPSTENDSGTGTGQYL